MQKEFNRIPDPGFTAEYVTFRKFVSFVSLILALFSLPILSIAAKADQGSSPVGLWKTEDAQVEIFEADGKLNGKIAALNKEYTSDGIEKTDISNPNPEKRKRPLIGLVFMTGFTREGPGRWDHGTVYDPKTGNTYASFLEYDGGDTLKLRGYIGISLIGRTAVWTKVKE
ncbi:MAG: DUF2147 domain-containing protein [Verrucomicrobia bacterium]|nr:DUF2147 domain-containing protein [Verrucomicrobiota bacterium]